MERFSFSSSQAHIVFVQSVEQDLIYGREGAALQTALNDRFDVRVVDGDRRGFFSFEHLGANSWIRDGVEDVG